jgi:hypothetical protein
MKLKSLLVMLAVASASTAVAFAAPPQGKSKPATQDGTPSTGEASTKGKPPKSGPGCRPRVSLVLKGVLADAPGAAGTSISLKVTSANHHGALFTKAPQPVKILVGTTTVVRRQGQKTLGDLVAGDRLLVRARACKADLADKTALTGGATPELIATRIVAHPGASSAATTSG